MTYYILKCLYLSLLLILYTSACICFHFSFLHFKRYFPELYKHYLYSFLCDQSVHKEVKQAVQLEKIFAALTSKDCYPKCMESTCKPGKRQTAVEKQDKGYEQFREETQTASNPGRQGNVNCDNQQITRLLTSAGEIVDKRTFSQCSVGGILCQISEGSLVMSVPV